jgi:hypothetical protein
LTRPNARWIIPTHVDGPAAALELARQDHAAVVILRVLTPKPDQSFNELVREQAQLAAENLGVERPWPEDTKIGGQKAVQIAYEGRKILSGNPARCTNVYTQLEGRVLAIAFIVAADADPSAAKEADQIRASVKLPAPAKPK